MSQVEPITIATITGLHFRQSKFDECYKLAERLHSIGCKNLVVWYDNENDFHHCDGEFNRFPFTIRYYIVYTLVFDGQVRRGPPHNNNWIERALKEMWSEL